MTFPYRDKLATTNPKENSLAVCQTQRESNISFPSGLGQSPEPSSICDILVEEFLIAGDMTYVVWSIDRHMRISEGRGRVWVASLSKRANWVNSAGSAGEHCSVSPPEQGSDTDSICYPPPRTQLLTVVALLL